MKERVLVIGLRLPRTTRAMMEVSLEELRRLVEAAEGAVVETIVCELRKVEPRTVIGRGKVEEIARRAALQRAQAGVVDTDLTPAQNRNLNEAWGMKVLDRTAIILDIFARRAHSNEGKLQVALAQLQYRLPRLSGKGLSFSQQAGYIGNRGPGETKLEIDRRRVREEITTLRRALHEIEERRAAVRRRRRREAIPVVALVGYTNAGKSTLLNAVSTAEAFVEDKLFTTLDPVTRRVRLPSGRGILLTDTVGFIRRLPHQLVEAFKATFEEVADADCLLHVIDASAPDAPTHIAVVEAVLHEMAMDQIPRLTVYNKCDRDIPGASGDLLQGQAKPPQQAKPVGSPLQRRTCGCGRRGPHLQAWVNPQCAAKRGVRWSHALARGDPLRISALTHRGIPHLLDRLEEVLTLSSKEFRLRLPHTAGDVLADLYRRGTVRRVRHLTHAIVVDAALSEELRKKYRHYVTVVK